MPRFPWLVAPAICACATEGFLVAPNEGEQRFELAPGDPVRFESLELAVPEPGFGVGLVVETDEGWLQLEITQEAGGGTVVRADAGRLEDEDVAVHQSALCNRLIVTCSECRDYGGASCCTPTCPSGFRAATAKTCTYLDRSTARGPCMEGRVTCEQCTSDDGDPSDACLDSAFRLVGRRWQTTFGWRFNPAVPAPLDATIVENVLVRAADNITTARNDCGRADGVGAQHLYRGRTTASPRITVTDGIIRCGGRSGANVVGFGAMSGLKAATCWYWDGSQHLIEAHVKFNSATRWSTSSTIPAGCSDALDFQSVATHEFGHAFGLLHPGAAHPLLTMQPGGPCDASKRTLGLGDLLGLEALY